MQRIKISKKETTYDKKENLDPNYDLADHLSHNIFKENSSIIVNEKKSYLLYRGKNYDEVGYCYSLGYSMDVIRTEFSHLMKEDLQYEIHIKRPTLTEYKIYLYQFSEGYLFNGLSLIEKYKVREIPKIEKRESPLPATPVEAEKTVETKPVEQKPVETKPVETKPAEQKYFNPLFETEPERARRERRERREKRDRRPERPQ